MNSRSQGFLAFVEYVEERYGVALTPNCTFFRFIPHKRIVEALDLVELTYDNSFTASNVSSLDCDIYKVVADSLSACDKLYA